MNKCEVCSKEAESKCAACGLVYYCSRQHQKLDWKAHKTICSPYTICEDPVMGRYLAASRDISVGEVILKEKPLLSGPQQSSGPVCLGCYRGLTQANYVPCPTCGWPLCSLSCATSPDHRPECHWTTTRRTAKVKISQFTTPHPTYGCVMPLRYCYKKTGDPKSWERLNSLECHSQKRVETDKYEADRFGVVNLLRRFYNITEFSEEEILRICGVIQINGHEVPLSDPGHVSVFWRGSMFEHNCRANCSKSFSSHGELLVRAMEDIPKGGHLSICYTDPLWATGSRQMHLSQTKFFNCSCQRCKDPTELGHFLSAIKCTTGECQGRMLPTANVKDWQCDVCGTKVGEEKVAMVHSQLGSLVSTVNKTDTASCKKYLEQATTLVPESHYLVREIQLALAQLYGQTVPIQALTDEDLQHKDLLCRKLIKFTDSLIPAECRIRGVLHFELHAAVAESTRRKASQGLIDSGDVYALLMESKEHLEKAKDLLKYEPEVLPEGKIAKQIEINLKDLETVLRGIHMSVGVSPM